MGKFLLSQIMTKSIKLDSSISVQLKSKFSFQKSNKDGVKWKKTYEVFSVA